MSYQKKYYFSFKDLVERLHLVELWQNTEDILVAEEIKGHMDPFTVEMPEIENKFQVVRGKGCQINLLSETDSKFFTGLYHVDPTDFMVIHKIDSVISFLGYLNAEMMTEPYDIDFNYLVSVTGNDGFSLMDRFSFISADDGTNHHGIASKFGLLQIVFAKIGLPFTEYRISLSTTFTGYSGDADSSILHESFVDCSNFYDEDEKPMSLREVIDSILAPYGARIYTLGEYIYIDDIHTLASDSTPTYKRFDFATGAYIADVTISNEKAIADVGYMGTGQSIERSGGVNRQVVAYSPYPVKTILEESIVNLEEFTTVPATFSAKDGYSYKTLDGNKYWEVTSPATFEVSYFDDESDSNIYMRYPRIAGTNQKVMEFNVDKYLTISAGILGISDSGLRYPHIKITGKILVKTKLNPYDEDEEGKNIKWIAISCRLKIGDKYYNPSAHPYWSTTPSNFDIETRLFDSSVLSDTFVDVGGYLNGYLAIVAYLYINTPFTLFGNLGFEIWSEFKSNTGTAIGTRETNSTDIKEIWLNELIIGITDGNSNEIPDNDIEYIGLLDRTFQNEGEKITLTCGTDTLFADRAKILKYSAPDYSSIKEWTRNGQTYRIEELLLASVSSNYRAGFLTLMGMKLKNSLTIQNIITDTFIGAAKMMVKSARIDYRNHVFDCSLVEILPDELIIVKDTTVK